MVSSLLDISPLLPALARGEPVITANNRLRNHLLRAYGQHQRQQGIKVWKTPDIFTLSQWLQQAWQVLQDKQLESTAAIIASGDQRVWLWEKVIADAPDLELLLAEPLAQSADTALTQLERWCLEDDQLNPEKVDAFTLSANSQSFYQWLQLFRSAMAERGWITRESAWQRIADAWQEHLPVQPVVHLLGFDALLPLESRILNAAATTQHTVELPLPQGECQRTTVVNEEQEILAAALWSRDILLAAPDASIGIIVPNLGQIRDKMERIFGEVFEPLAGLPEQPRRTAPFNFSAGTPLASTPLIHCALNLLGLNRSQQELEPLCDLLLSPFFGNSDSERLFRGSLVQRLRDSGQFFISSSDLRYHATRLCEQWQQRGLPDESSGIRLLNALNQFYENRRHQPARGSALQWSQWFADQLAQLGWPGERRPDSQEYQQLNQWYRLLEQFATLDSNHTGQNELLSAQQALTRLFRQASKTPFQAQTPDSPIQILGALEGDGLHFDYCWMTGLHHRQWPPAPAPNPFLPISMQRELQMPHASAEREFQYASRLTRHYRQCAKTIIFSSPAHDDIGELRTSALIEEIPQVAIEQLIGNASSSATAFNRQQLQGSAQLQLHDSRFGPPLGSDELVRGGSSLLRLQAACPFHAFAQLRLGARWPEPPVIGFSAMERGTLLHDALAFIWKEIGDSNRLQEIEAEQLTQQINTAVSTAMQPLKQRRNIGDRYAALEQQRLVKLIGAWLEDEKERPPFRVVAIEESRTVTFAGLMLNLRIDRIDELGAGQRLVIDYKTGSSKVSSWLGDRPDEPQLPLYAISNNEAVDAIAFAQLNAKGRGWAGLGIEALQHPGIAPPAQSWPETLQLWQSALTHLAEEFKQGDARVEFKNIDADRYSEALRPLNRCLEKDAIHQWLLKETPPLF